MLKSFIGIIFIVLFWNELVAVTVVLLGGSLHSFGTLTVTHKLTKKSVMTIRNVCIFNSNNRSTKATMYLSSPFDACSKIDKLSNDFPNLHSLTGSMEQRLSLLLVQDINCDIKYKLSNAHDAGYTGIIIASEKSCVDIEVGSSFPQLYVALLSSADGQSLQKLAKNSYSLQFHRDPLLSEEISEGFYNIVTKIVQVCLDSKNKVLTFWRQITSYSSGSIWTIVFYTVQVVLLLSPIAFLAFVAEKVDTEPVHISTDDYTFFFNESREQTSWHWENNNDFGENNSDDEESLQKYRDLLGVTADATKSEIETEFRKKSLEFHPDKNMHLSEGDRELKTEEFKKLASAKISLLKSLEC